MALSGIPLEARVAVRPQYELYRTWLAEDLFPGEPVVDDVSVVGGMASLPASVAAGGLDIVLMTLQRCGGQNMRIRTLVTTADIRYQPSLSIQEAIAPNASEAGARTSTVASAAHDASASTTNTPLSALERKVIGDCIFSGAMKTQAARQHAHIVRAPTNTNSWLHAGSGQPATSVRVTASLSVPPKATVSASREVRLTGLQAGHGPLLDLQANSAVLVPLPGTQLRLQHLTLYGLTTDQQGLVGRKPAGWCFLLKNCPVLPADGDDVLFEGWALPL